MVNGTEAEGVETVFTVIFPTEGAPEVYIPTGGGRNAPLFTDSERVSGWTEVVAELIHVGGEDGDEKGPGEGGGAEEKGGPIVGAGPMLYPGNGGKCLLPDGGLYLVLIPTWKSRAGYLPRADVERDRWLGPRGEGRDGRKGSCEVGGVVDGIGNSTVRSEENHGY
jgi:hypothetical protein